MPSYNFGFGLNTNDSEEDSFSHHLLYFGNPEGELPPDWNLGPQKGILLNMEPFLKEFNAYGSISCNGRRSIVQSGEILRCEDVKSKDEKLEDYCALLLDHENVENKLLDLGLDYLQCGEDDYLESTKGGLVVLFGHPGQGAEERNSNRPLRISFGREKDPYVTKNYFPKKDVDNFLFYDNDTLEGNSGSPVIGRGDLTTNQAFCVKGIHTLGSKLKNTNQAQKIKHIKKWIAVGNN